MLGEGRHLNAQASTPEQANNQLFFLFQLTGANTW
jgi:hypothetical protein